jgi:hypothetical protein
MGPLLPLLGETFLDKENEDRWTEADRRPMGPLLDETFLAVFGYLYSPTNQLGDPDQGKGKKIVYFYIFLFPFSFPLICSRSFLLFFPFSYFPPKCLGR